MKNRGVHVVGVLRRDDEVVLSEERYGSRDWGRVEAEGYNH